MSCKSALYGVNTNTQTVAVNGVVNFGQIVRRFGCHTNMSSGNVVLKGIGYYDVVSNVTINNTDTTNVSNPIITFYKDGVAIPGAVAEATIASSGYETLTIPFVVRETCDCESTITAVITNASASITNATVKVVKL